MENFSKDIKNIKDIKDVLWVVLGCLCVVPLGIVFLFLIMLYRDTFYNILGL